MEYLFDALLLAIVFWLGKKYQTWQIMADIYNDPDHYIHLANKVKEMKLEDVEIKDKTDFTTMVRAEVVNDIVYLYDKATGEFLGQGVNHLRALELAVKRYPNKRFRIDPSA